MGKLSIGEIYKALYLMKLKLVTYHIAKIFNTLVSGNENGHMHRRLVEGIHDRKFLGASLARAFLCIGCKMPASDLTIPHL